MLTHKHTHTHTEAVGFSDLHTQILLFLSHLLLPTNRLLMGITLSKHNWPIMLCCYAAGAMKLIQRTSSRYTDCTFSKTSVNSEMLGNDVFFRETGWAEECGPQGGGRSLVRAASRRATHRYFVTGVPLQNKAGKEKKAAMFEWLR